MNRRDNSGISRYLLSEDKILWSIICASIIILSIAIIAKGPVLANDSYSYLRMSVFRPAGYALFLYCMRIFGEYQNIAIVVVQTMLNSAVIFYFLIFIQQRFIEKAKYLLLFLPLILFFLFFIIRPERILTESLAFPLFLLIAILVIDAILQNNYRKLLIASIVNVILVLVRGQFLLIFPFLFLVSLYILYREWDWKTVKKTFSLGLFIILSLLSTSFINKTYHYVVHDTFADTQMNMSFIMNAMYVSEKEDYKLFEDEQIQHIHQDVYNALFKNSLNKDGFIQKIKPALNEEEQRRRELIYHYHENLLSIGSILDSEIISDRYDGLNQQEFLIQRTELFKILASEIIYAQLASYIYVNLADIYVYGFGGNGMYLLLFLTIYLITFIGLLKNNDMAGIIFLFQTAYLLNFVLISLSNRVLPRYTFYYEFVLISLLIICFIQFFSLKISITNQIDQI